jgi:transposase-like protein
MILVAYGVTGGGLRRVLAYQFAQDESQAAWEQFLQDLFLRGLEGKALRLIVSDGGKGLQAALPFIFPNVPVQRCWAHRRPNAVACVERDLDAQLNFFAVPQAHRVKVRTTNVIERAFREVRRRTRPISSFSDPESCDRIVYGVIRHLNRSWERKPLPEFTQTC